MENKSIKQLHSLTLDLEKYEHYLANSDMTEAEKQEYLRTLWDIICEFVAMGFHVHPVQDAINDTRPPCGKHPKNGAVIGDASLNALESTIPQEGA